MAKAWKVTNLERKAAYECGLKAAYPWIITIWLISIGAIKIL
jgi:hypothetical protein